MIDLLPVLAAQPDRIGLFFQRNVHLTPRGHEVVAGALYDSSTTSGLTRSAALMVFNSLHFVVFFAVVYALYRVLPHRAQNWMLLAASYYFYAAWDWRFLGLLVGIDRRRLSRSRAISAGRTSPRRRRAALVAEPRLQPRRARLLQVLQLLRRQPGDACSRGSAGISIR